LALFGDSAVEPIDKNWTDENGLHQGGVSTGIGFTIAWQRGPLNEAGRNGAFLLEVLESCRNQVLYFQDSQFACQDNLDALSGLGMAIEALSRRKSRRAAEGTLGTHELDKNQE
jgi:hypothetical protein